MHSTTLVGHGQLTPGLKGGLAKDPEARTAQADHLAHRRKARAEGGRRDAIEELTSRNVTTFRDYRGSSHPGVAVGRGGTEDVERSIRSAVSHRWLAGVVA